MLINCMYSLNVPTHGPALKAGWLLFLLPLSCLCQCFGLFVVTCGSLCTLLRSQRVNTLLQIETSTRTIHNHILRSFCDCVHADRNAAHTQMYFYNKAYKTCIQYMNTHLGALASVSHVRFLQSSIRLNKGGCLVLFFNSRHLLFPFHNLSLFFSSWVFMRGRLWAVIPVLYITWHHPVVRPQRLIPTPDWTVSTSSSGISGTKVFIVKVKEVNFNI